MTLTLEHFGTFCDQMPENNVKFMLGPSDAVNLHSHLHTCLSRNLPATSPLESQMTSCHGESVPPSTKQCEWNGDLDNGVGMAGRVMMAVGKGGGAIIK